MVVGQRRNEIAVLRSRGATIIQVLGMAALESLLLGIVGVVVGSPGASAIAAFFSRVTSFMNFSASPQINTDVTLDTVRFGLIAAGISLIFMVIPTIQGDSSYDYHIQTGPFASIAPAVVAEGMA